MLIPTKKNHRQLDIILRFPNKNTFIFKDILHYKTSLKTYLSNSWIICFLSSKTNFLLPERIGDVLLTVVQSTKN